MAEYYVNSATSPDWLGSTAYALGQRVVCTPTYATTAARAFVRECTTAGTSGATQPTWVNTAGATTTDGTVVWTARAPTTWANASGYLHYVINHAMPNTGGDRAWLANTHNELNATGTSDVTYGNSNWPFETLLTVFSTADTTTMPPTTLNAGAKVRSARAMGFMGFAYYYGIEFAVGTDGSSRNLTLGSATMNSALTMEECKFTLGGAGFTNLVLGISASAGTVLKLINPTVTFGGNTNATIYCQHTQTEWYGGTIAGTLPTTGIFGTSGSGSGQVTIVGMDLTSVGTRPICQNVSHTMRLILRSCKLPTSAVLVATGAAFCPGAETAIDNCDSGSTNYRMYRKLGGGTIQHETTVVRTGGASNGTTPLSWKLITLTASYAPNWNTPMVTPPIAIWNDVTGTRTVTVEIVRDSATPLTDKDIWLEVEYLGTSGAPQASLATDRCANYLSTGVNQATSTAAWTTTGLATPTKQKLEVTLSAQFPGPLLGRVYLTRPTTTVYVDPVLTVA